MGNAIAAVLFTMGDDGVVLRRVSGRIGVPNCARSAWFNTSMAANTVSPFFEAPVSGPLDCPDYWRALVKRPPPWRRSQPER